jgi:hypothetical protein
MKQGASANGIIYAGTKSYDTNKTFFLQDIQDIKWLFSVRVGQTLTTSC